MSRSRVRGPGTAGVTLVELLVAMAIAVTLAGLAVGLLRLARVGFGRGEEAAASAVEMMAAFEQLRQDVAATPVRAGGHALSIEAGGATLALERSGDGGVTSRVEYRFDPPKGLLTRAVTGASPGPPVPLARGLSEARFEVYSSRLPAPLIDYDAARHDAYSPIFLRVVLASGAGKSRRDLVTSLALQPITRRQLDPYWSPPPSGAPED